MPITLPVIDNRRYQDLLDEALARIPVYTPEWTNFNKSDPGVTLIEVFAFLTESLLYRANQIPERNRKKFLRLLGIGLQPATPARGIVAIANEAAPPTSQALNAGIEFLGGQISFRSTDGVDVLPIEARFYVKAKAESPSSSLLDYYRQLYASFRTTSTDVDPVLYRATPFPTASGDPINLSDTVDGAIWLAIAAHQEPLVDATRTAIAGRSLSIGVAPQLENATLSLPSGRPFASNGPVSIRVEAPIVEPSGGLPDSRDPRYLALDVSASTDVLAEPGVLEVTLPQASGLTLWNDIDPLERGVNNLPPSLDDDAFESRIVTWLRISPSTATEAKFLWMGANCVEVTQRTSIAGERLVDGSGEPDQTRTLANPPVLSDSVTLSITANGSTELWTPIDDLSAAPGEIPVRDPRLPPGSPPPLRGSSKVFAIDAESGVITFGDGIRGARPSEGAIIRATYDFCNGAAGNVGPGAINGSPALGALTVSNPIPTWGGADAQKTADGEKSISTYLQHRDRLVTATDFLTIAKRTPGVEIGRIEVVPNYNPSLTGNRPGDAAGAVTLMIIPAFDAQNPRAPVPDRLFLDAICRYLDPRRLATTEVYLRGPNYRGIYISIGIKVEAGVNDAPVREEVKQAIYDFLAPVRPDGSGWRLTKAVVDLELATVAARVPHVDFVTPPVLLAEGNGPAIAAVEMSNLDIPKVLGISVTSGDPLGLDSLRGLGTSTSQGPPVVRIPFIPEECR